LLSVYLRIGLIAPNLSPKKVIHKLRETKKREGARGGEGSRNDSGRLLGRAGIENRRLQLFDVVGLQPPRLRMVLAQNIPSLALAPTTLGRVVARIAGGTTITAPASIFKHWP